MNDQLQEYNRLFMGPEHLDMLIHQDAEELHYIYEWRLEQEQKLQCQTGTGMSDADVIKFGRSLKIAGL